MIVLAAVGTITWRNNTNFYEDAPFQDEYNVTSNGMSGKTSRFQTDLHGNVNILLGGAMISGVIIAIILMCYCCHKNARKYQPQEYSDYWRGEAEAHSLEVYTTDSHSMCYDRQSSTSANPEEGACGTASCPITPGSGPGPPPAYDSLIFDPQTLPPICDKKVNTPDAAGSLVPSVVSALFRSCNRNAETTAGQTAAFGLSDEGLPSYEAALQLDASGYV